LEGEKQVPFRVNTSILFEDLVPKRRLRGRVHVYHAVYTSGLLLKGNDLGATPERSLDALHLAAPIQHVKITAVSAIEDLVTVP
jgi:hypothetical protein